MPRKLANIAANMRANFFCAVRRVTQCQALSGALHDVRRCQARYTMSGAVRRKKTAHDSAARIGNKKAALGGLIGFYRVK